jgi:hypothetical protein
MKSDAYAVTPKKEHISGFQLLALVRVDPHVLHLHCRRENGGRVHVAGPVAAHRQVQDDEHRSLIEGPGALEVGGVVGCVHGAVHVVDNLPFAPRHAVGVPRGTGESIGR